MSVAGEAVLRQRAEVSREAFGRLADGSTVEIVRLRSAEGFVCSVITFGAAIQEIRAPDRNGRFADVVLGHDDLDGYVASRMFFGATVGRVSNRIANGAFTLDGVVHHVAPNDGPNALHGGHEGFDRRNWTIVETGETPEPFVTLALASSDGDQNFPGRLDSRVTFRLSGPREVSILFEATTDRPTIAALTNHTYFDLGGEGDILDHQLRIEADRFLAVDPVLIPMGDPRPVAGTPFDFREPRAIGEHIRRSDEQILTARGYDHNFCLRGGVSAAPRLAARVEHRASGRVLELHTDQPGVQFYSGNFLDGTVGGKNKRIYRQGDGFCLEPQSWPDAANRPDFPPVRLDPGRPYRHHSMFRFSVH